MRNMRVQYPLTLKDSIAALNSWVAMFMKRITVSN
jgi:hypothetical protein